VPLPESKGRTQDAFTVVGEPALTYTVPLSRVDLAEVFTLRIGAPAGTSTLKYFLTFALALNRIVTSKLRSVASGGDDRKGAR
jgi:hypothetical protein